jgi:hypothetical protein
MNIYTDQDVAEMLLNAIAQTRQDCLKEAAIIAVNAMAMAYEYRDAKELFDGLDAELARKIALQALEDYNFADWVSRDFVAYLVESDLPTAARPAFLAYRDHGKLPETHLKG